MSAHSSITPPTFRTPEEADAWYQQHGGALTELGDAGAEGSFLDTTNPVYLAAGGAVLLGGLGLLLGSQWSWKTGLIAGGSGVAAGAAAGYFAPQLVARAAGR